ncbi:MAG: hypothetical protein ACRDTF_00225, partial [Pseudonocardiaceae bacterium]
MIVLDAYVLIAHLDASDASAPGGRLRGARLLLPLCYPLPHVYQTALLACAREQLPPQALTQGECESATH